MTTTLSPRETPSSGLLQPRLVRLAWGTRLRDLIGLHEHDWTVIRTGEMNVHASRYGVTWAINPAVFRIEKCRCGQERAWITELAGVRKDVPYEADPKQIIHPK